MKTFTMKNMSRLTAAGVAVLLAASGSVFAQDSGTRLSVVMGDPVVTCNEAGTGAAVEVVYTVVSTASADSAVVTADLDGATTTLGTIASGNVNGGGGWTFSGRTKSADGTYANALDNGTYALTICATQSGAQGRLPKQACSITATVVVNCTSPDPCASVAPFGDLVGNPSLCKGNTTPIHWKGSFGDNAWVTITFPDSSTHVVDMSRSGESCVYQGRWDSVNANGGPGSYSFKMEGGGNTNVFSRVIEECKEPK